MNIALWILLSLMPSSVLAWEDMSVHQHYTHWIGVLPSPHDSIEVEITLYPENDDLKEIRVLVGGKPVHFPPEEVSKLKDVNLDSLKITHGMHRDHDRPNVPIYDDFEDYIVLNVDLGDEFKVEWQEDDEQKYLWGYNTAAIAIVVGEPASVYVREHEAPYNK